MKFVYPQINEIFRRENFAVPTLVIENQRFFHKLIKDISLSIDGISTDAVLSEDNKPIDFSKNCEIISDFINFNLNKKNLISKVCSALESICLSPEFYVETQTLLAQIENLLSKWTFEYPCDITATKLSISNIIKSLGIELNCDYPDIDDEAEKVIDYMELVREFDRDKFFITVNMRSFFPDSVIEKFITTCLEHEYNILMIEAKAYPLLKNEKRVTIDSDLCEF